MAHKRGPADDGRARKHLTPFCTINPQDRWILAQRIGHLREQELIAAEVEAGVIIDLAPSCPRWASQRVDQLTLLQDRRLGVEVAP